MAASASLSCEVGVGHSALAMAAVLLARVVRRICVPDSEHPGHSELCFSVFITHLRVGLSDNSDLVQDSSELQVRYSAS